MLVMKNNDMSLFAFRFARLRRIVYAEIKDVRKRNWKCGKDWRKIKQVRLLHTLYLYNSKLFGMSLKNIACVNSIWEQVYSKIVSAAARNYWEEFLTSSDEFDTILARIGEDNGTNYVHNIIFDNVQVTEIPNSHYGPQLHQHKFYY